MDFSGLDLFESDPAKRGRGLSNRLAQARPTHDFESPEAIVNLVTSMEQNHDSPYCRFPT